MRSSDMANLDARVLSARLLSIVRDPTAGYEELAPTCSALPDINCWREATLLAKEAQTFEFLEAAGSSYLALACSDADSCATAARWLGDLHMQSGYYLRALDLYSREANERPSSAAWHRLANAAEKVGQHQRAQTNRELRAVPRGHRVRPLVSTRVNSGPSVQPMVGYPAVVLLTNRVTPSY